MANEQKIVFCGSVEFVCCLPEIFVGCGGYDCVHHGVVCKWLKVRNIRRSE